MGFPGTAAPDRLQTLRSEAAAVRSSERAWIALGVGVAVYEIFARDGELLSHQVDRWLESHPIITTAVISLTAAHLLNWIPPAADPWARAFNWRSLVS